MLMGKQAYGIDFDACQQVAQSIQKMHNDGIEIGIVIGGGNIFRGINLRETAMQRTPADHMGMLATMINGIALQQALESVGCHAQVMSAIDCPRVAERFNWAHAREALNKGIVLVFTGGTGNPYFTTDTCAALRASEIDADILLKATKVDGVYDKDPIKHQDAVRYEEISYKQVLSEELKIMDSTAIALCQENNLPILVFNMNRLGNHSIKEIILDKTHRTLVKGD